MFNIRSFWMLQLYLPKQSLLMLRHSNTRSAYTIMTGLFPVITLRLFFFFFFPNNWALSKSRHLFFFFGHATRHAVILVPFSSVAQSCPALCDPMDCSTPDCPVHHQLLELAQTHVHRVSDAIQPSHLLSSPSPPAFNLSQHQGLF